jgi:hypothetical protein
MTSSGVVVVTGVRLSVGLAAAASA